MKYKDIPLLILATILIALSTYHIIERNDILMGIGIGVFAIYTITYVIICIKREKRLEGELLSTKDKLSIVKQDRISLAYEIERIETDLANQVKATNEAEKELKHYKELLKDGGTIYINGTKCVIGGYDKESDSIQLTTTIVDYAKEYIEFCPNATKVELVPFSEDSQPETQGYICTQCGKPMTRMTEHTVFCDNIECTRKQWKRSKLDRGE